MIDTIINVLYYVLFLLAPLIMNKDTSELFEFNKMLFIYLITVLVLFFWILKMIINKRLIIRKTRFDIFLLVFLSTQILSTVFSIDRHTSFFGYYGRFNGGLLSIFSYIILFYGFISNVPFGEKGIAIIQKLLKASLVASFLVILWGLPGKFGFDLSCFVFMGQLNNTCWTDQFHPELRMFSTLGQPDWLGAYMAIHFFIALYFLLKHFRQQVIAKTTDKKGYIKQSVQIKQFPFSLTELILFGYFFLNFSTILFTRSRSAVLSVMIGLIVSGLGIAVKMIRDHTDFRINIQRTILALCVMIIPILLFKTGLTSVDRILSFSFLNRSKQAVVQEVQPAKPGVTPGYKIVITDSLAIRKIVWKGALDLAHKYPLFGSGLETFAYAYYFVRPQAHNLTSEWDYLYNKAHNEYLNYLATTGYAGTIAYLFMIGFVFYLLFRLYRSHSEDTPVNQEKNLLATVLSGAYISILVTNFFGFSTTTVNLFFYLIPAFILIYADTTDEKEGNLSNSLSTAQWMMVTINGLMAVFLVTYFVRYYFADIKYASADTYEKKGDYQTAASLLTEALQLKYEHVYEDKLSYDYANLAVIATYQKQRDIAVRAMGLADSYNRKTLNESPQNVLYWKTKAKNDYLFYQITLQKDIILQGIDALNKARDLSPTDPKIPYSLAIYYSLLGDEDKNPLNNSQDKQLSLQTVDKAIDLKPDYRDSYVLKGQLQKKYGDKEGAKKTFEYILANINSEDVDVKKELESL